MGGKCRYSCFLLYRGSASFIAADFDSIRAYRPRYDSDPIIVRSLNKENVGCTGYAVRCAVDNHTRATDVQRYVQMQPYMKTDICAYIHTARLMHLQR